MTKDDKIITEAKEYFKEIEEYYSAERDQMRDDAKFAAGEQWPDSIRKMREQDPDGARPCLTMDRTGQYRRQVINDARQNKPSIKVRPADNGADIEVAEILQGVVRHIEDASSADVAYDTALDHAVTSGIGWFRILTKVIDEQTNAQEITIARVANFLSVYPDCDWSEPDGSDIKRLFIIDDVPKKKFELQYPKSSVKGWDADDWVKKDSIRIAEYYRVSETESNVLMLDSGDLMTEEQYWTMYAQDMMRPQVTGNRTKKEAMVEWFKLCGGEVLDRTTIPSQWIPTIPVIGNEMWIDGQRRLTGMISLVKDAQRAYNYARSAEIEQVALAPKAPYIAADGQIEPYAAEWKNANRRNSPVLRYVPQSIDGMQVPPPQRQQSPGVSQGWMQEMELAERDIQSALGMYGASIGAEGQEKSGRAIMARQKEGDTSTFHYIDNLSRSIKHAGRIVIDMIPRVYDTKRLMRIIGNDGEGSNVVLDPNLPKPMAKIKDESGKIKRIFNPSIGKYDVAVTVGPSYNTKRQEAADAMVELTRANPNLMPLVGDLMIRAMDWPMAEEIADRLKTMLPPEIKQSEQEEGEGDEVKAAVQQVQQQYEEQAAQAMQAIQMLQQQLMQAQRLAEESADETALKNKELDIKAAEVRVKGYEAETERLTNLNQPQQPQQAEPVEQDSQQFDALAQMLAQLSQKIDQVAAVATQPQAQQMPIINVTVEKGGAVRKEMQIHAPSGQIYSGVVSEFEQ